MTNDKLSGIRCYRFGRFTLDAHRCRLWRDDESQHVSVKAIEVLTVLVERAGEVVSKDDLLTLVWPQTMVEENNLARHVSTLRKLLGDNRELHDFIVTIPGHGYRFVATVDAVSLEEVAQARKMSVAPAVSIHADSEHPVAQDAATAAPAVRGLWRPGGRSTSMAAAVVLMVTAVPLVLWMTDRAVAGGEAGVSAPSHGALTRLTYGSGLQHQPSWSPDATRVVFASDANGSSDLWVQDGRQALPVQLTSTPESEWQPAWSPDGRWIVYRSERDGGGLEVMPSSGGAGRRLAPFGFRPRWSPSGRFILFSSSILDAGKASPWVVDLDGQTPRAVRPDVLQRFDAAHVAWRPDRDRVSVWGRRDGRLVFLTMSLDGVELPVESPIPAAVLDALRASSPRLEAFSWAPSGDELYFEGSAGDTSNLWRVAVDRTSLAWLGHPSALTMGPGVDRDFVVSPDGRRVAFSVVSERTRLWSFGLDAEGVIDAGAPLTSGSAGEFDAAAPRDGLRLAFRTLRGGRQQLWERSMSDGAERVLLAGNDWRGTSPRWAHDGRTLAYGRRGSATAPIALVDAETGAERLLTLPPHLNMDLVPDDWSSDGSTILAACRPGSGHPHGTCLVSIDESSRIADVRVIAAAPRLNLICQRFSPDQQWISFMAVDDSRPGTSTLYVMPAAGGPWVPLTSGTSYDDKPRWSSDGRIVYFISDRSGPLNLWARRFDAARGTPVGEPFKVSSFDHPARLVNTSLGRVEIAVSSEKVFLPLTDRAGDIWVLDLPGR